MTQLKTGKLPPKYDHRTLAFASYVDPDTRIPVPASFGHEKAPAALHEQWGMLGNDNYGDCVWAGADHEHMLWEAEHGVKSSFSDHTALSDYAAVTGFNPFSGSGDNGTNVLDALNYRRQTGVVDNFGQRHKIGAFVALEPGNWNHLLEAIYLFGVVGVGIAFPDSAMSQFNAHKPWSVVPGAPTPNEGHYIPFFARRGHYIYCLSWGRLVPVTKGFYTKYNDESYAILSQEHLAADKSPEGFNLAQLTKDLPVIAKR